MKYYTKHKGQQQQAVHGELTVTVLGKVRFLLYKVIKIKHVSFHIVNYNVHGQDHASIKLYKHLNLSRREF